MADVGKRDLTHDYASAPMVDLKADRVLGLCDPRPIRTDEEGQFIDFWEQVQLTLTETITTSLSSSYDDARRLPNQD